MRPIFSAYFVKVLRQFFKATVLISLFSAFTACQKIPTDPQTQINKTAAKKPLITDGFFGLFPGEPIKLNVDLKAIRRTAKSQAFPVAPADKCTGSQRKFINEQLNSRSPITLSRGEWNIAWQADLPSSFPPSTILEANDRVLLESDGIWLLFDHEGKKLTSGQLGASGIVLDGDNFLAANSTGLIMARSLSDGSNVFGLSLAFGDAFERTFMLRRGQKFLAISTERELDPHKSDKIENSLIELVDLGDPMKIDRDGLLTSSRSLGQLVRKTKILLAAANDETLVLATQNRVYLSNLNLEIQQAFTGEFIPLTMSLDESGRIYLIVKQKTGYFFWLMLPNGELAAEFELPAAFAARPYPPIVGLDHRVYLAAGKDVLSIDQTGKLAWRVALDSDFKGAVITADNQLLVTAGKELLAFDAEGKRRVLFDFGGQEVATAPVLTASGSILITTRNHLLKLSSTHSN